MAIEDTITLDGQTYIVQGPVAGRSMTEWSAGLKIGRATYDDREHVFFLNLDDFSGGIGTRKVDLRESLGGFWDNPGGVDVRRSRHITLPPEYAVTSLGTVVGSLNDAERASLISTISGTEYLYVGLENKLWTVASDRTTVVERLNANFTTFMSLVDWRDPTTQVRALFAFGVNNTYDQPYYMSTNGTTFSTINRTGVFDAVAFDDKIVAALTKGNSTVFGYAAGFNNNDPAQGLHWNVDDPDPNVSKPLWTPLGRVPQIIGVTRGPWGSPAVYFIDLGRLYVLDFEMRRAVSIDVGENQFITTGTVIQGQVYFTDGWNVWVYDPSGAAETVRRIGIGEKFGWPESAVGWQVKQLVGGTGTLYAILYKPDPPYGSWLWAFTGAGWTPLSSQISGVDPGTALVDRFSNANPRRALTLSARTSAGAASLYYWKLPKTGEFPTVGTGDAFFASSAQMITGWYDGGFQDLTGALYRMEIDGFHLTATETVQVEYRLNNDENAAWTLLGTFNNSTRVLWFDAAHRGVSFRTIQFRITLSRGADNTLSPEIVALVLVYDKRPTLRTSWAMRVDVMRMIEQKVDVGGSPATFNSVYQALRNTYQKPTLVPLTIPQVGTFNVKLVDIPLTLDDFRDEIKGKGFIDISALEPVAG